MNRRVVVKLLHAQLALDERFVERFQQEARAQASVTHPNIVTVFDAGILNQRPYIVMEYIANGTLRKHISTRLFTSREALLLLHQLSQALERSHSEGLVHRDIKPENILIDQHGNLKLSDFGLARMMEELCRVDDGFSKYYEGGFTEYLSPEQQAKPWVVDARADIYSAIVVFYEAMMGELPRGSFTAPSSRSRLVRPLRKQLDTIVFRGLQSNPSRRFQSASELRDQVEAVIDDPRMAKRISVKWFESKEERRLAWLALALFLMFLQTAGVGYLYVRGIRRLDKQKIITNRALVEVKQKEEALAAAETELKRIKEHQAQGMSLVDPNEVNAILQFSDSSAWLHRDFGANHLPKDERLAINRILTELHQDYLHTELANTTQEVRPDETIVSTIRMNDTHLKKLEQRLWLEIDAAASLESQRFLRDTLPLFVDCTTLVTEMPGKLDSKRSGDGKLITTAYFARLGDENKPRYRDVMRLFPSKLRYPQLFGWSPDDLPIRISIRRRGMWFAWSIEQSIRKSTPLDGSLRQATETFRIVDSGESPAIPAGLRRFWWDPLIGTDKSPTIVKKDLTADVLSN